MENNYKKDRNFGLVMGIFFTILGIRLLMKGNTFGVWLFSVAVIFFFFSLFAPNLLHPLNRLWMAIGVKMGNVMTPVSMLVIYIIAVLPTAIIMRLLGKDPLRLKLDKNTNSYWMSRSTENSPMGSMKNQF